MSTPISAEGIDNPSSAYAIMYPRIVKNFLAYNGTEALRLFDMYGESYLNTIFPVEASKVTTLMTRVFQAQQNLENISNLKYLEQFKKESIDDYFRRIGNSFFYGAVRETVDWQVGRVFSRDARLLDGAPDELLQYVRDVDGRGTDLNSFAKNVFRDSLIKGFSGVLVDFPSANNISTLAQRNSTTPRMIMISAENLLGAEIDDSGELVSARIIFNDTIQGEDFIETSVSRIHYFRKEESGTVYFSQFIRNKESRRYTQLGEEQRIELNYIPLFFFYAGERTQDFVAENPLNDLVDECINHYRLSSSYNDILKKAAFPMLLYSAFAKSDLPDADQTIAPNIAIISQNPGANVSWVEPSGNSIAALNTAIDASLRRINALGADTASARSGSVTATERAIDSAQQSARVRALANSYQSFLTLISRCAAEWLGFGNLADQRTQETIVADLFTDFSFEVVDANIVREIIKPLFDDGRISEEQYFGILKSVGFLNSEFDIQENRQQLDEQAVESGNVQVSLSEEE